MDLTGSGFEPFSDLESTVLHEHIRFQNIQHNRARRTWLCYCDLVIFAACFSARGILRYSSGSEINCNKFEKRHRTVIDSPNPMPSCSTCGHRDREIRAWSVSADACRPALAGYSSASAVQVCCCCDSPSLSSATTSKVPRRLLCASLRTLFELSKNQWGSSAKGARTEAPMWVGVSPPHRGRTRGGGYVPCPEYFFFISNSAFWCIFVH